MTLEMFKRALRAGERGEFVSIGFHLHEGIHSMREAFGDLDRAADFLEDVEAAEDPLFKKEEGQ